MITIGIDPELTGAIAIYAPSNQKSELSFDVFDMPTTEYLSGRKKRTEVNPAALAQKLRPLVGGAAAIIEKVGARPGQGVVSMFRFGQSYGAVIGVIATLGIRYTLVPPATWKRALNMPPGKDAARYIASQRFPEHAHHWPLKKHHGRAEAALIALYGSQQ